MPSDNGAAWAPPAGSGERRLSNSSDGSAGSGYSKALPLDNTDYLQLRAPTLVGGKPVVNPLQFVKVGPCGLYRSAQEQLKRAQEVKKNKEVNKEELEDWQSNLDNWKSSRRKRVEHIIERCVEVKRMENEPSGARAKSKTFNEMLEERAGKRRRCPVALYPEEEATDLSDLGIGTSSTKSSLSEDCDTHSLASDGIDLDKNHSDVDNLSNCGSGNGKLGSSANEYDTCTTTTISSPEPEEYTYEGAIEGYKSRISSQTHTSLLNSDFKGYSNNNFDKEKSPVSNGDINRIRTTISNKIEEKVSSLQQNKDVKNNNQKKDLPKVDILRRREQFEKESSPDTLATKPRLPEISHKKSIKERLSSLEKFTEETQHKSSNDISKLPTEVVPLKDRLFSLEKIKAASPEIEKPRPRLSNGNLSNTKSVKERLSSLKSQTSEEDSKIVKTEIKDVSVSLKQRLSSLDAAKNKEVPKQVDDLNSNDDAITKEIKCEEPKDYHDTSLRESLSGIENQMQNFCRSLDSLDINGASSPSSFGRVQSLEDFESCNEARNNTSPSDVETEDSGIHTAHGSCAPDDTQDMTDLIENSTGEPIVDVSEYESSNEEPAYSTQDVTDIKEVQNTVVIEEIEDVSRVEDTDSASNYLQAISQPTDDLSATDEITEIQMDKDDEDTLKSLDPQDTSVSLNEPVSTSSEGDVVFEGKMLIHLNLKDTNAGAGNDTNSSSESTNSNISTVTVSNITTNLSPKNSIKSLRSSNDSINMVEGSFSITSTNLTLHNQKMEVEAIKNSQYSSNESLVSVSSQNSNTNSAGVAVIDALELAFQEIDYDMDPETTINENDTIDIKTKLDEIKEPLTPKVVEISKEVKKPQAPKIVEESRKTVAPVYENIEIFYENGGVLDTVVDGATFPLDMPAGLEPPKEKPPPPPTEDCIEDDIALGNGNFKSTNSTRRIKKEIRNKRTSFLGIEGQVDDSYLDADLKLAPRPDITSFLQEETKIEKLLYKKTLSHDMDSKLRESRDSGVDLDRGPSMDAWYKQSSPETSNPHSRQNSEPYTHVTVTSDEEETARKASRSQFSAKLTTKLENLNMEGTDGQQAAVSSEQNKIDSLDKQLQKQQECVQTNVDQPDGLFDDAHTKEVLRFERELLQLEQEELRRQRDNLLVRETQTRRMQKSVQDVNALTNGIDKHPQPAHRQQKYPDHRHSMPNLLVNQDMEFVAYNAPNDRHYNNRHMIQNDKTYFEAKRGHLDSNRHVALAMEDSKRQMTGYATDDGHKRQMVREVPNVRPPMPLPPKPRSKESMEREITMRSSRVPSAVEYANVEKATVQLRPKPIINGQVPNTNGQATNTNGLYHPMSRHTLQVLSAAPTPKLIQGADWLQARSRKQIPPSYNYNQHWLIQEAEQRRIEEQRSKMRLKQLPNQRHSYHHDPTAAPHSHLPVQNNTINNTPLRMNKLSTSHQQLPVEKPHLPTEAPSANSETMLSVSGRKKCSHCGEELGRGAAMIIESLELCYHVWCFSCVVCGTRLGDGRAGADVRVRARRLHCHQCYSSDDGRKFSCV